MKRILTIASPTMLILALLFSYASANQSKETKPSQALLVSQPAPPEIYVQDIQKQKLIDAIQIYFNQALKDNEIVGASISIVKCDSIIYSEGFGHRNAKLKDTVNAETVFRIGSVSKGFAGILTGIHVQEGLINWEDKIIDHIPNFRLASKTTTNEVTLSNVLSHTAGLPYHSFTNLVEDGLDLTTIAGKFNEVLPIQEPGSVYNYQNAIFALSGEIMERVTGKTMKEIMKHRIFDPLQMHTASASYEALQACDNVAMPHQRKRRGWKTLPINKKYYNAVAAGGVNASAKDMGKWMKFLLGNNPDVLMPATIQDVFNPKIQVGGRRSYYQRWPGYESSYYGMGWRIHKFNDETGELNTVIHHGGSVNNYRSEIAIYPNEDLGICVLFNSPNAMAKDCIPKIHEIIQNILNSSDHKVPEYIQESLVSL